VSTISGPPFFDLAPRFLKREAVEDLQQTAFDEPER